MLKDIDSTDFDTLFLDRDGVINRHLPDDYVKSWSEFEFLPSVLESLAVLSKKFKHIIIVTNQRGVGKGIMSEEVLNDIHIRMIRFIEEHGGRIDKIYYCTDLNDDSPNRKPNIGMALQAKRDFPDINFKRSIMIGDSESDMEFGLRLSMKTISVKGKQLSNIVFL